MKELNTDFFCGANKIDPPIRGKASIKTFKEKFNQYSDQKIR